MHNPYRSLPPLDLLVSFEAAARHLSFTLAGAELFLTQSAVSRQIGALETALGTPLFHRRTRALELTAAGAKLLRLAEPFLQDLKRYSEQLREAAKVPAVRVTTTHGVAGVWLLPRLAEFQAEHPGVEVSIAADNRLVDLSTREFDLAIRMVRGTAPQGARQLFANRIAPVLAPALARKLPVGQTADLARHVLIHSSESERWPWLSWPVWFERAGVRGLRPAGNLYFGQFDQAIYAAIHGQGVALANLPLVAEALAAGRLLAPLPNAGVENSAYYLIVAPHAADNGAVRDFVAWLLRQVHRAQSVVPKQRDGAGHARNI